MHFLTITFHDLTEAVKNIIEGIAIIIGGWWALYRFGLFREKYPSMEISNGIIHIGENSDEYLLELYCIIENKGKARKWIAPLDFELLYLNDEDKFIEQKELNEEIEFKSFETKDEAKVKKFWVSPDWHIPFVDGESKRRFKYLTKVPKTIKYLSLYTRFIDFNDKSKAVDYILSKGTVSKFDDETWNKKSFEERVMEVRNMETDFYYTQATFSIEKIKNESNKIQLRQKPES
jgi:hypothetical protein